MIIIISILFTTALVLGIKIVTHEKSALNWLKLKVEEKLPKVADPLISCEFCMPTLWSSAGWIFTFVFLYFTKGTIEIKYLVFYPITIVASSFFSGILWTILIILLKINDNN